MDIQLYNTFSPDNMLSKVLATDSLLELSGELTREYDVLHPVFRITANVDDAKNRNYLIVPDWNRCYYIRNFKMYRTGVLDIYCKEDVLTTYANEIRNCNGFVSFGADANPYREGFITSVDVRSELKRVYTFDSPFTNGSFVLVGIKGERKGS